MPLHWLCLRREDSLALLEPQIARALDIRTAVVPRARHAFQLRIQVWVRLDAARPKAIAEGLLPVATALIRPVPNQSIPVEVVAYQTMFVLVLAVRIYLIIYVAHQLIVQVL